jgi:hypothetical protein
VEITDEDGEVFPVARQVTRGQAERLIERIAAESQSSRKPIKAVMAATIITLKHQSI